MSFKNKTVLITGGSRGIGRVTAIAFAAAGARVAINYKNNHSAADATIAAMPGEGHIALQADLANPEDIHQMVEQTINIFGQLDILVNNAGIFFDQPIDKTDYTKWQKDWHQTINVNLIGAANTMFCATQHMIRQGGGRIVNVSSRGAFRGEPESPAYGASKAGLNALSQSLAQKLAPYQIFIGTVAPGFVATDMASEILSGPKGEGIRQQSPLGRVAFPEEVAKGILFLASEGTEFMTGCILDINGASYLRS